MENKGLLKLPETWHVIVKKDNQIILSRWITEASHNDSLIDIGCIVGISCYEYKRAWNPATKTQRFGQEITFADFKRLVLGENNYCDYGVRESDELEAYFIDNKIDLHGGLYNTLYYFEKKSWRCVYPKESGRQTLPLQEYLKLIEPKTMEKKYEYKLRDKKYLEAILKINPIADLYDGRNLGYMNSTFISILENLNVLDLFFEKIEVKELTTIIGGSKPIISEDGDLIEIAGFQIDMYIIYHFKSFTLGNDVHVSESDVKQIREYLKKTK